MTIIDGIAILGALAWLPHLIKMIRDVITRPAVRIIAQRTVEIGYNTLGPILNLRVAFSVCHRDIVISSIKIKLIHESGNEKVLSWQGIIERLGQLNTPEGGPIPWEKERSVLAIKLTEKEIEERLIRFHEDNYHTQNSIYESKVMKKLTYLKGKGEYEPDNFLKSEEMKDHCSFIEHWFNWKQGRYTVIFEVNSPEKFILKDNKYQFSLNPLNIESLEVNKDLIALSYEDIFKWGIEGYKPHNVNWNWAYPILERVV